MIDLFRRLTDHWLSKTVLGLLALVFVFFFSSSGFMGAKDPAVVMVNGRAIRERDLNRVMRNMEQGRNRARGTMTETERLLLRDKARDELIRTELLQQEAERLGVVVSDGEIREQILDDPQFHGTDGKFSKAAYDKALERRGGATSYERDLREFLVLQKLSGLVSSAVVVNDAQLREAWEAESATRDLTFVRVAEAPFREAITLSDADVETWIKAHEGETRARYDRDYETVYKQPKRVRARHILMKFEDADDASVRPEVRRRMDLVAAETKAPGADFEALARKYSEDSSATRGGDLGLFDESKMVAPFSKAAFAMQAGQISDIVETQFGLHIIQVVEVQEAKDQGFDEVKVAVARELMLDEQAPAAARAYAEKLRGVLDGSLAPEAAAALLAEKGVAIEETGPFSRGDRRVPKVPGGPEVVQAAFALQAVGETSKEPVKTATGWALFKLRERNDGDAAAFDAEKDKLRDRVRFQRQQQIFDGWIAEVQAEANVQIVQR